MWHASIARPVQVGLFPTDRWGAGMVREGKRWLLMALAGVGKDPTILTMRQAALHMRRSLSDVEMEALSHEWLAIPARDEFSEDGEMEMAL